MSWGACARSVGRDNDERKTMANEHHHGTERIETVIIGGGQAGLAVGYHLAKRKRPFVILEAGERIGDAWRRRWDSLRLFTPARYDGLPGLRFPAPAWSYPTKDEQADYLEGYAARFELPVITRSPVDRLSSDGERFVVSAAGRRIEADRVVVASGAHRAPKLPEFASRLDPEIVQLHSSEYRNPGQLQEGGVLVVGAGNSGAEIAFELAGTRPTWLAGRDVGEIPVRHGSPAARVVVPIMRFMGQHVLTVRTPIGRKVGPKVAGSATPLIRRKSADLLGAGVERVPRVAHADGGLPVLEDGRTLDVANVVWCTGFRQDFSWIDLPVFDERGLPVHESGIVGSLPGLYFAGLRFQHSVTSDVLPGVGQDAKRVAKHIARAAARRPAPKTPGERSLHEVELVV
jgi:putative flavoprotein involved in K+ transport